MKSYSPSLRPSIHGSALVAVMVLLTIMGLSLAAVHSYTNGVLRKTARNGEYLRANAAAEAAIEVVVGRLSQWVTANSGYCPSIGDCATVGVPGDSTFPTISGAITFPANSTLNDYTVSAPQVFPVLPDDSVVTNRADAKYLPDLADRIYTSENSSTSVTRYYFTKSATLKAKNVPSRSLTYRITATVTPKVRSLKSVPPITLTRFLRCDKISPFNWCTYRMGSASYQGSQTYTGPLYLANNVAFRGSSFTDSVLYGGTATNYSSHFLGSGYAAQVNQTSLLSLVPNLMNNLAIDSDGNRQASDESNTAPPAPGLPAPADMFSTRELIEPPSNPANDLTPPVIREARIYNQADVRIKISVTTTGSVKTVNKSLVHVDGSTVDAASNPWVAPLLAAIDVKALSDSDPDAFMDRSRSASSAIQATDINVGAMKSVMEANPTVFPTGIIYAWDATGLSGGTRPLTGVRLWNAGELPSGGLVVGSNDPIYLKGDFNTGATLPPDATIDSAPVTSPASNGLGRNSHTTTVAQRMVPGYTLQPAGVFGDEVIELSNGWQDANSRNTPVATSTTINLVEGWSTGSANELRADDTYLDPSSRANPVWIESWHNARRTMSGEELVVWHSKYCTTTNQRFGGNWKGDISYDPIVTNLKLNWGTVNFVRDRVRRE